GPTIALTGATLVNGITNPNVYTPPPAVSGQVISLGPVSVSSYMSTTVDAAGFVTNASGQRTSVTGAAGLPSNSPVGVQTVAKPTTPSVTNVSAPQTVTVTTISGEKVKATYLTNNPAAQVVDSISSASLIAALPANLRPGSVPFYYDPYTENQQIEQAALEATGKSSFYSTPSATDSTSQASINNQDKAALYGAALEYAKQNNIALGTQLSQAQLAQINAPMLWYVEQTVPEPGCTATGNGSCPTVQALMPEVLLPQNYAVVNADGEITGKDVTLNFVNSILDTGTITAETLHLNTNSLTSEQRSTNIGTIYTDLGDGVGVTTGTVVQQGGFISAANYDMNVQALNQVGGALQKLNADGSVDTDGTHAMLANLKSQLGSNFTQSTVSNNLHTDFIADSGGVGAQIMGAIAAVFAAVIMQPEISAGIMSMTGAADAAAEGAFAAAAAGAEGTAITTAATVAGGTFAVGGVANTMISVGLTSFFSSMVGQVVGTGQVDFGSALQNGLIGAVTAGLTNGITFDASGPNWSWTASPNSLASLAGVQNVGNTLVPQASVPVAGTLPEQALAVAGEAVIQASVQTGIGGGSFLTNLRNSAVSDVAAVGAYAIGNAFDETTGFWTTSNPLYAVEHAVLGCAGSAANGTGCASGAIGGAVSAMTANSIATAVTGGQGITDQGQLAAIVTATSLLGGAAAGLLGQNALAAMTAAQNETLNNTCAPGHNCGTLTSAIKDTGRAAWNAAVGTVEAVPNFVNGALPGYPDYVPFLNGAMLPYDDPDFGSLVSLVGAAGAASLIGSGRFAAGGDVASLATADSRKFSDYIFATGADHGKNAVFESLGYSGADSASLTQMWEQQAAQKYAQGQYTLGKLDQYGQRINIEIALPGKGGAAGQTSYLRSGWMIQGDGSIKLNTPFSGFTRSPK
ncbi:adhesin, partial [Burkholderia reimsis]